MSQSEPAVQFDNAGLTLPDGRTLLHSIRLSVPAGSRIALLGRSGSGKTTLLRLVNRLVTPTSGRVLVHGADSAELDPIALRRSIGYVIQETGLFPHMTVERNAGMALELAGRPRAQALERGREMLALVGLDPTLGRRYPHQLSGGQRQRVGLARALASNPSLLLMDEPFGALDPLTRIDMQRMVLALLQKMGTTVLVVTHDMEEALFLADRILLIEQGRIAEDLTPQRFLDSASPLVREYVRAFRRQGIDPSAGAES